jgi:hypothetical protein
LSRQYVGLRTFILDLIVFRTVTIAGGTFRARFMRYCSRLESDFRAGKTRHSHCNKHTSNRVSLPLRKPSNC